MLKILQILNIGRNMTPECKTALVKALDELGANAAQTAGSADDRAIAVLVAIASILGIY